MNLRKMRTRIGITQTELARRMGVRQNTITQWELGNRQPRAEMLPKLADTLGCTLDELLRAARAAEEKNPAAPAEKKEG